MARKIVHQLVDDLDGTLLETGEGETLSFSLGGTAYEIDLSDANARSFRDAFAPYISAGRTVRGARSSGGPARGRRTAGSGQDTAAIREWAKENGHRVSERGRISADVVEAYNAAH